VRRMLERYRTGRLAVPAPLEAVRRLASRWPLGLASSSNRRADPTPCSSGRDRATLSRHRLVGGGRARGKPAPDVYLEAGAAARRSRESARPPSRTRRRGSGSSARRSGMRRGRRFPNPHFPPRRGRRSRGRGRGHSRRLSSLTPDILCAMESRIDLNRT
jgi:hypothetical protein